MTTRRDVVAEQLRALADDLENLWNAATRDPKQEARRARMWTILSGALSAGGTMASRRLLAKIWPILTGEAPPSGPGGGQPSPRPAPSERPQPQPPVVEESETPTTV
jgi:hypothetical protein